VKQGNTRIEAVCGKCGAPNREPTSNPAKQRRSLRRARIRATPGDAATAVRLNALEDQGLRSASNQPNTPSSEAVVSIDWFDWKDENNELDR
jgi:hypothetical protein